MADITLTSFTNGVPGNPVTVERNFYTPSAAGTGSLEGINGHLDDANRATGGAAWKIDRSHLQQGALSGGGAVGSNLNLDYFGDIYNGWLLVEDGHASAATRAKADKHYQVIPGGSITFNLPYQATLLVVSWSIFAGAKYDLSRLDSGGDPGDINFQTRAARIRLYVDGARQTNKEFVLPAKGLAGGVGFQGTFDRFWSGFILLQNVAAGWHSVSLRTVMFPETTGLGSAPWNAVQPRPNNQTRVRVRHMDYVYFR